MKEVYAKLRDEHIETLKKLGTLQKEADFTKKNAEEASTGKNVSYDNFLWCFKNYFYFY